MSSVLIFLEEKAINNEVISQYHFKSEYMEHACLRVNCDVIFVQLASPLSVEVGNDDGRTVLTPRFPNITQLQFALVRRDDQTVG